MGAEINTTVAPLAGEAVVTRSNINGFLGTDFKSILDAEGVTNLVIVGAMSPLCIDALARAASDLGYGVTVVHDAVATRDLEFGGRTVSTADVHASFMAALAFAYATVLSTDDFLSA